MYKQDCELTLAQKYGPYAQKRYSDLLNFAAASANTHHAYQEGFESDIGMDAGDDMN